MVVDLILHKKKINNANNIMFLIVRKEDRKDLQMQTMLQVWLTSRGGDCRVGSQIKRLGQSK